MDIAKINKIFSSVQKDIALLESKVSESQERKKFLKKQALFHIASVFPKGYKKLLGDSALFEVDKNAAEKISDLNLANKSILGCSITFQSCSIENIEKELKKTWLVEGKLSQLSFIVEYSTTITIGSEDVPSNNESFKIQKLDIFPQLEVFEDLSNHMIASDIPLNTLIPSLYMFQTLQEERNETELALSQYSDIETSEEENYLIILVAVNSFILKIKWGIFYNMRGNHFRNNISLFADDDMKARYSRKEPILSGKELLTTGDELLGFIKNLLKES